jgi:hypothetical protein|tara:strand:+ start:1696 stop:2142 length:447 start_codon:yes stop_codon:yes gene_type:complete
MKEFKHRDAFDQIIKIGDRVTYVCYQDSQRGSSIYQGAIERLTAKHVMLKESTEWSSSTKVQPHLVIIDRRAKTIAENTPSKADQVVKPPIGLMPKKIAQLKRMEDIFAAVVRYNEADVAVPAEWLVELNKLIIATSDGRTPLEMHVS